MQRQYFELKKQCPENALLFFRLGDFYELFYDDAKVAAAELGLTLTARHKKSEQEMPMCGVPHHAADKYLAKLTKKGFSIAMCEQVSDPSQPGIVKREIVQIITPGTTLQEEVLQDRNHNYLAGLVTKNEQWALGLLDVSTGDFRVILLQTWEETHDVLYRFRPAEIVTTADFFANTELTQKVQAVCPVVSRQTLNNSAQEYLKHFFEIQNLASLEIENKPLLLEVSALILAYLQKTQKRPLHHIRTIKEWHLSESMYLDPHTIRNLEIFSTLQEGQMEGSLLAVLDNTFTSAGGRLLKKILISPLLSISEIEARLDSVSALLADLGRLKEYVILRQVLDIERIVARLSVNRASPRDLLGLKHSLDCLPQLVALLEGTSSAKLQNIRTILAEEQLLIVRDILESAIDPEAPVQLPQGGVIRDGYDAQLDRLRQVVRGGKEWLQNFEDEERQKTGINTLKVAYNRVYGYYIEISKGQSRNAPENYVRRQTLTNAERYISPVLKEYEDTILEADSALLGCETSIFQDLCQQVIAKIAVLQDTAKALAELDVYVNFANIALKNGYVRPEIVSSGELYIKQGRHPVIEKNLAGSENFVPNDSHLSPTEAYFALITGPNMAGKSTYLRQNALITLLAQIGCFVPAEYARVSIVDRIFTRIGASDNMARGKSTFLVEMEETAYILKNATRQSFIILDEVGRGTSTYDGLALAWAIFEYLHDQVQAKTFFATHYHELIALAEEKKQAVNLSVAVTEKDDKVIFLHSVVAGGADRSYGIEVAKIAGVPNEVVQQAEKILEDLEKGKTSLGMQKNTPVPTQASLLADLTFSHELKSVMDELMHLDINALTPMEALKKMDGWQVQIKK